MAEEVNNENIFLGKTKAVFNLRTIRFVLIAIISMLTVLSIVMVILGNIAYWHYHHYAYFYDKGEMGKYVTPSALCMFIGAVLFVVSGFGCYGSLKNSTCAVNTYAAILSVLFILQLVALGLAYSFDRSAIWIDFEIPVAGISDPDIREKVDYIQSTLGCCGSSYFTDYLNTEFPSDMATVKVSMEQKILVMPASCCISSAPVGGYCANLWPTGCTYTLLHKMEHHIIMIGVIFVCVMCINLLGMIFALLLAHSIRKMKSEKILLRWRIQEEVIMGREIEASSSQLEAGSSRQPQAGSSRELEAGSSRQSEIGHSSLHEAGPSRQLDGSSRQQTHRVIIEDLELTTSEV